MTSDFPTLRDDEIEIVNNAPAMVSVLIAGADNKIDDDEITSAISFCANQKNEGPNSLHNYFTHISEEFEELLKSYVEHLPKDLHAQQHTTIAYLRQLNTILPKIDQDLAIDFHAFLLDLAKAVANASGGVMGFKKVSKEEAAFLDLGMIDDPNDYEFH